MATASAAAAAPALTLKIVFKDDIRRFQSTNDAVVTLEDVSSYLCAAWPLFEAPPFAIRWTDEEGDTVTISTEQELIEARRAAGAAKRTSLKLFVEPALSESDEDSLTSDSDSSDDDDDELAHDESGSAADAAAAAAGSTIDEPSDDEDSAPAAAAGEEDSSDVADGAKDANPAADKPWKKFLKPKGGAASRSPGRGSKARGHARGAAKRSASTSKKAGKKPNKRTARKRARWGPSKLTEKGAFRALKRICKRAAKFGVASPMLPGQQQQQQAEPAAEVEATLSSVDAAVVAELRGFLETPRVIALLPKALRALYYALVRETPMVFALDVALGSALALASYDLVQSSLNPDALRTLFPRLRPVMLALGEDGFVALGPAILEAIPAAVHGMEEIKVADFMASLEAVMRTRPHKGRHGRDERRGGGARTRTPTERSNSTTRGPKYRADVESHNGASDNPQVAPGETFVRTWNVKNSGAESWPHGVTVAVAAKRRLLDSAERPAVTMAADQTDSELAIANAASGDVVQVSVRVVAPAVPGHYKTLFRLVAPGDDALGVRARRFGQQLSMEFAVVA